MQTNSQSLLLLVSRALKAVVGPGNKSQFAEVVKVAESKTQFVGFVIEACSAVGSKNQFAGFAIEVALAAGSRIQSAEVESDYH